MGTGKRNLRPYVMVNGTSLATSFTGPPTSLELFDRCCIEVICTGTPTGTPTIQGSCDYFPPSITLSPSVVPATWTDIPLGMVALAGSPQSYFIDFSEIGVPWIRVNYTAVSGAGNMTAVITAKES